MHAWAVWTVYSYEKQLRGRGDTVFLKFCFEKLSLNFTWWVNRKDEDGNNVFSGGFLGLDNIGVFDRSSALPTGGYLDQSDGTAWMAFFASMMLQIAVELAMEDDRITRRWRWKCFEHFYAAAMDNVSFTGIKHWDHARLPLRRPALSRRQRRRSQGAFPGRTDAAGGDHGAAGELARTAAALLRGGAVVPERHHHRRGSHRSAERRSGRQPILSLVNPTSSAGYSATCSTRTSS